MAMRTAEDVANMETELYELRQQLDQASRELLIADTERKTLKIENTLLLRKCEDSAERATKMETIIQQVSFGLVSALKEMKEDREIARAVRREVQEQQLGVGGADAATFLTRGTERTRPRDYQPRHEAERVGTVETQTRIEHYQDDPAARNEVDTRRQADPDRDRVRTEQLRGAAEHISTPPSRPRPAPIDHTLAARDSRLPIMDYGQHTEEQTDIASLEHLGGDMQEETRKDPLLPPYLTTPRR